MTKSESPLSAVVSLFLNSGPWAVMALVLVLGIGYEAHYLARSTGAAVSEYVIQSGKNNQELVNAAKQGAQDNLIMISSLKQLQDSTDSVNKAVLVNESKINELLSLMAEAKQMMSSVPAQREEQLRLLKEIETGIRNLSDASEQK